MPALVFYSILRDDPRRAANDRTAAGSSEVQAFCPSSSISSTNRFDQRADCLLVDRKKRPRHPCRLGPKFTSFGPYGGTFTTGLRCQTQANLTADRFFCEVMASTKRSRF